MIELRHLHLIGATGVVRTEMWDGREHLVVPCVALQEGVIHAVNAKMPEFVSQDILTASADKWNGHPLVVGHPVRGGVQISAHDPTVMAQHGFGLIRSARMNGKRLGVEALVDPKRLEALGQNQLLADLRAGKQIEVSIGAHVQVDDTPGKWNGRDYKARWSSISPDHLAFLPGGRGACSIEMGCGAHRAASAYEIDGDEMRELSNPEGINQYSGGGGSGKGDTQKSHIALVVGRDAWKNSSVKSHQIAAGAHREAAAEYRAGGRDVTAKYHEDQASLHESHAQKLSSKGPLGTPKYSGTSVKDGVTYHGSALNHLPKLKGASMASLKERAKALFAAIRAASTTDTPTDEHLTALGSVFDTPEQAASEEAAELVGYNALRTHLDAMGKAWDEASGLVDELIADETDDPTETPAQEAAEEEVETARLEALMSLLGSMASTASSAMSMCMNLNCDDAPAPSDPRYMEAFRAAIGKSISAKNLKTIQGAHDAAHAMHDSTTALGAACNGMKVMAAKTKDCPECDGTGQMKNDNKQTDCPTCNGSGEVAINVKAAEAAEETSMTPEQKAAALKALAGCGCDKKFDTDDQIFAALTEATTKHTTELKAAADAKKEADAKIKTLEAAQIPAEELTQLRSLATAKAAQDATEKTELVTKLVALKTLTEEQLKAKSLDDLRTLAAFAKIETPDFSGRGIAQPRVAAATEDFTPPNPYEAGLKALQGASKVN